MPTLRRFLCLCFAGQAVVFALAIPIVFRPFLERGNLPTTARGILGMVLAEAVLATPLVQTILCGMAWRVLRKRKPSGRRWAVAASLMDVVIGLQFCIPMFFYAEGARDVLRELMDLSPLIFPALGLGVAGLIAFVPRNSVEQMPKPPARLPRIAGDGTSPVMDWLALLLQVAGIIVGIGWWERWTEGQGLPRFQPGLLRFLLIVLLTTLLHECGHAIAGRALGMRLRGFVIGPFQWYFHDGRSKFKFVVARLLSFGGAVLPVPTDSRRRPRQQILMIAAGPLANLITGLIAVHFALMPQNSPAAREFLALFSTISLVMFAGSLVPFRGVLYSDGARIYQILAGGPLADYNHVITVGMSILVTPLRPRDYDIELIQRTARVLTTGTQGFNLRLLAYSYFLDRGKLQEAAAALEECEALFQYVEPLVTPVMYTTFIFGNAFVRDDAAAARQWWERMQAKKRTEFNLDYWLAKSALHWIEGDREEADAAWKKACELASRLPQLGAYECDRDACSRLREAMDHQPDMVPGC